MPANHHSFFQFGGSFLDRLAPHLQEQGTIAGRMTGFSPISEISLLPEGEDRAFVPWLPRLEQALQQSRPEYFVLDLQLAKQDLLRCAEGLISAAPGHLPYLKGRLIVGAPLSSVPKEQTDAAIDRLIRLLQAHFDPQHIILIHTANPLYWLAGANLRAEQTPGSSPEMKQWLEDLEQQFREKTGCRFVDVNRFYFYQKEKGRPVTDSVFEDECYIDVARRIASVAEGGDGHADRPDFGLSLDRYAKYFFTLQRKPQRVFLDAEYTLDQMILSSTDSFVHKFRKELAELDRYDWNEPRQALKSAKADGISAELLQIVSAFIASSSKFFLRWGVDYSVMFRNGVVPERIINFLRHKYAERAGVNPAQINRYNAGWHFARMLGKDPADFSTGETVPMPTLIDVFGSCVARTGFNVQDNDFAVNRYWFHVAPFEYRNKPAAYPDDLFPEKPYWTERLIKEQLDCGIYRGMDESGAEWLMLDLYFLIGGNNFIYEDCIFGDFDHRISGILNAKRVNLWREPNFFGSRAGLFAALDPWLEKLRSRYGKRIILIDGQRLDYWIGDDDRIYQLPFHQPGGDLTSAAFDYVCEKLGCYGIRLQDQFLPDELGYMRNTASHRENAGYFAVHDMARYIVDMQPIRKVHEEYPGTVHVDRLLRLMGANPPAAIEQAMPLTALDKAVIRMDTAEVERNREALIALFNAAQRRMTLEETLEYCSDAALRERLTEAAARTLEPVEIPQDYEPYGPDDLVLCHSIDAYALPEIPTAQLNELQNNRGFVVAMYEMLPDTETAVFRSGPDGKWMLAGVGRDGLLLDKSVQPETTYRYVAASLVMHNGARVVGGYSQILEFRTPLPAPQLLGAEHCGGKNTVRWAKVPKAEGYLIFRKPDEAGRWQRIAEVGADADSYTEEALQPRGEWYTVRAYCTEDGERSIGGYQPGVCTTPEK